MNTPKLINSARFEKTISPVRLFTLRNINGMVAQITSFGARIVSLWVPDKNDELLDVVCGFDNLEDYLPWNHPTDFGASIGRYANRINGGTFVIPGTNERVRLDCNHANHSCLHGGYFGWQYRVFEVETLSESSVTLSLHSNAGDNHFPGAVDLSIRFELRDDNTLTISYDATSDAVTPLNMTNHSYFCLSGNPSHSVDDERLMINADAITPADAFLIPTGEIRPVEGTVFDLRSFRELGPVLHSGDPLVELVGGGLDHNWCLNTQGDCSIIAASLADPNTGIRMDVYTNEPGIQCYTANFQDGTIIGKYGIIYNKHCAVCLETQKYPDSPNQYNRPGWEHSYPFVSPNKPYHSLCNYKFSKI